jgi:hypothetical protein
LRRTHLVQYQTIDISVHEVNVQAPIRSDNPLLQPLKHGLSEILWFQERKHIFEGMRSYLICCDDKLNRLGIKLSSDVTSSQGIYPSQLPMLCFCLIKLLEYFNAFYLRI